MSISVVEIFLFLHFMWKDKRVCLLLNPFALSWLILFFKNCLTCVKVQLLQQESKQTFTENLKFKKRDYHFQTEVVNDMYCIAAFYWFYSNIFVKWVVSEMKVTQVWQFPQRIAKSKRKENDQNDDSTWKCLKTSSMWWRKSQLRALDSWRSWLSPPPPPCLVLCPLLPAGGGIFK